MAQKSKARRQAEARYDREAAYTPEAAVELVKALSTTKFDEGVDAVFALGIDPKKADENVRGTVSLPHGTGKAVRVLVFAASDKAAADACSCITITGRGIAIICAEIHFVEVTAFERELEKPWRGRIAFVVQYAQGEFRDITECCGCTAADIRIRTAVFRVCAQQQGCVGQCARAIRVDVVASNLG